MHAHALAGGGVSWDDGAVQPAITALHTLLVEQLGKHREVVPHLDPAALGPDLEAKARALAREFMRLHAEETRRLVRMAESLEKLRRDLEQLRATDSTNAHALGQVNR